MQKQITLAQDMHVHSTFSDGINSIEENLAAARAKNLAEFCCVDHVRRDTAWVKDFAATVKSFGENSEMKIYSGLEAKILNRAGDLDVPDDFAEADFIYAADHQFPLGDAHFHPKEIREMLKNGDVTADDLIESLAEATNNAVRRYPNVVIAHLFSILPKVGLTEEMVSEKILEEMARNARKFNARIEVDERWKCPSLRTTSIFYRAGVPILFSSDSHRRETIGEYTYNEQLFHQLKTDFGNISVCS